MEDPPRRSSPDGFAFSLRIDVGKTSLELALRSEGDIIARTTVPNDQEGHNALVDWLFEQGASPKETCVCMEASGDFEKAVARRLYQEDYRVSVVNPRRIKGYASSQLQRTKTDSADAALIARFGRREDPRPWEPPEAAESRLQEPTRARQALQKEKTRAQNGWTRQRMKPFPEPTRTSSAKSSVKFKIWRKRSRSRSKRIQK
jgi:transposase